VEVHLFSGIDLDANIDDIIRKLDSIYGSVDRKEILLTQFYGARQEKDEDISHWSCRLERIIGKCVDGGLEARSLSYLHCHRCCQVF
jgi:hypothetical protein